MLVIDISINRQKRAEEVGIVRIPNEGQGHCNEGCTPMDDEVFEYKYGFIVDGRIPEYLGTVEHRYGDCGMKLASTVLAIMVEQDSVEKAKQRKSDREAKEILERRQYMEDNRETKEFL
jgi:hypothetical protein